MTFREFLNRDDHMTTIGKLNPQFSGMQIAKKTIIGQMKAPKAPVMPSVQTKPDIPQGVMMGRRFTSRDSSVPTKPSHFLPRKSKPFS